MQALSPPGESPVVLDIAPSPVIDDSTTATSAEESEEGGWRFLAIWLLSSVVVTLWSFAWLFERAAPPAGSSHAASMASAPVPSLSAYVVSVGTCDNAALEAWQATLHAWHRFPPCLQHSQPVNWERATVELLIHLPSGDARCQRLVEAMRSGWQLLAEPTRLCFARLAVNLQGLRHAPQLVPAHFRYSLQHATADKEESRRNIIELRDPLDEELTTAATEPVATEQPAASIDQEREMEDADDAPTDDSVYAGVFVASPAVRPTRSNWLNELLQYFEHLEQKPSALVYGNATAHILVHPLALRLPSSGANDSRLLDVDLKLHDVISHISDLSTLQALWDSEPLFTN